MDRKLYCPHEGLVLKNPRRLKTLSGAFSSINAAYDLGAITRAARSNLLAVAISTYIENDIQFRISEVLSRAFRH
jgi:hypothetical protein